MKIDHIECINLLFDYPARRGFQSSGGTTTSRVTSLVLVHTDGAEVGIGSAYSHPALVQIVVQQLSALLRGHDLRDVESIWEKMYGWTRWFGRKGAAMTALGGIDVALWDLRGKSLDKPVWQLLGGDDPSCPAYASSLLWNTFDGLAAEAVGHLERGFRRMKMRLGRDEDYDTGAVAAVRQAIGPQHDLMCDASMRYHLSLARRIGQTLTDNRVFWYEEPFAPEDLDSFAALRSTVRVPIAAGENEFGTQGFRELIERRAVDIVQADASRCGGASGDSVATLQQLLAAGVDQKTLVPVVDPSAAAICQQAGVGTRLSFPLGHQIDRRWGTPLTVAGEVIRLTAGKFRYSGGIWDGQLGDMGPTAIFRIGSIEVLITSHATYDWNDEQFQSAGMSARDAKFVVVKNPMNYRMAYGEFAKGVFVLDTPGPTPATLRNLQFRQLQRPYFPIDLDLHEIEPTVFRSVVRPLCSGL